MSLTDNLVSAMLRSSAEALVLHVGERPYVVTPTGNLELSTRELTFEAVVPMLEQLLSTTSQSQLEEFGAVQDDLRPSVPTGADHFTVVAARGGEDIWIELRRHRPAAQQEGDADSVESAAADASEPAAAPPPAAPVEPPLPKVVEPSTRVADTVEPPAATTDPLIPQSTGPAEKTDPILVTHEPPPLIHVVEDEERPPLAAAIDEPAPRPPVVRVEAVSETTDLDRDRPAQAPKPEPGPKAAAAPPPPAPAVVVPMRPRPAERPPERPVARAAEEISELERLLRIAAARKATMLYVVPATKPSLRVEGEIRTLDTERTLTVEDVEALVLAMMPEGDREALRRGTEADWVRDLPEVGRVRCTRFRDHRGPGAVFQLVGGRSISADELGLPRGVRELADETDGLIVITGPRASGKSTLFAAMVDLITRARSAHIITLEPQIKYVHQSRGSIVSQREVRGDHEALLAMARTAQREAPDVLGIEDLRAREVVAFALQAAESGQLVFGTVPAPATAGAIERLIDQAPDSRRSLIQRELSDTLRGVVSQVLVRKIGGGRVAAREVLRNTVSVSTMIADGDLSRLPAAIENGRRAGMVSLNDSLLELVRGKIVDVREAYRHAVDRDALVKLLDREGIDTSFVERMA